MANGTTFAEILDAAAREAAGEPAVAPFVPIARAGELEAPPAFLQRDPAAQAVARAARAAEREARLGTIAGEIDLLQAGQPGARAAEDRPPPAPGELEQLLAETGVPAGPVQVPIGERITAAPAITRATAAQRALDIARGEEETVAAFRAGQEARQKQADAIAKMVATSQRRERELATEIGQARGQMDAAASRAAASMTALENARVDPDRMWREMPASRKAASFIAAALGGFVEGFTQGRVRNRAVGMINAAIDRDVAAQRATFQQRLQRAQMDKATSRFLMGRYDQLQGQRRANAQHTMTLQLTRLGLGERDAAKRGELFKLLDAYSQQRVKTEAAARPQVQEKRQILQNVEGAAARSALRSALRPLPVEVAKDVSQSFEGVSMASSLMRGLAGAKTTDDLTERAWAWLQGKIDPTGLERIEFAKKNSLALALAVATQGSRPTDEDVRRVDPLIASPFTSAEQMRALNDHMLNTFETKLKAKALMYGPRGQGYSIRGFGAMHKAAKKTYRDLAARIGGIMRRKGAGPLTVLPGRRLRPATAADFGAGQP